MPRQPGPRRSSTPASSSSTTPDITVDVIIHGLATGGDAVGRQQGGAADGRTTFVALAAPGERVRARLVRQQARVAWGELLGVDQPSGARVTPPCPLFGHCGGCQWQHIELGVQRASKRAIVARALGLADVPLVVPVDGGGGYRDRAQFVVGAAGQVGFRARRSHAVVDVQRCHLLSPALNAALGGLRAGAAMLPEGTEIDLQGGREGVHAAVTIAGAAMAAVDTGADAPGRLARRLWAEWGAAGVVGVRVAVGGRMADGQRKVSGNSGAADVDVDPAPRDGADGGPAGLGLRIPAGAFAQVGAAANAALVVAVMDAVGPAPGAVLELYAGSGNFTRYIMPRAARLVACDADAAAVERGRRHVPGATWSIHSPAAGAVDADTVLADPPRDGLDGPNFAAAVQARHRFVYVSCDPQTLGRDAARLVGAGFRLRDAVALDLMPHTFHVEVVAVFERVAGTVAPAGR